MVLVIKIHPLLVSFSALPFLIVDLLGFKEHLEKRAHRGTFLIC